MKHFLTRLDPYRQSFFFFHWNFVTLVIILIASILLTISWKSSLVKFLLDNVLVYLPNYLTHEMLGHNLVGNLFFQTLYSSNRALGEWIATLAGNGVETLVPLVCCWFVLRLQGGRWLMPPLLYWLATTFYGAGVYAQDARACSMPLTSSDMVTNYKPGEICGDWNHILGPIGLLNYDQVVAYTFLFIGSLVFVLSVYSAWYYWAHPNFYAARETLTPTDPVRTRAIDDWQPPEIANSRPVAGNVGREYPTNGNMPRVPHLDEIPSANHPHSQDADRDF